jgi:wyosine [tRNA(Phe)-imidazoG37] synthetase (radical SAM superfamily)
VIHPLHQLHERSFDANRFVYPVLSRRSRGLSIGVNLNPDKVCNFDCIYCQVDRTTQSETRFVELDALTAELEHCLHQDVPQLRPHHRDLRGRQAAPRAG